MLSNKNITDSQFFYGLEFKRNREKCSQNDIIKRKQIITKEPYISFCGININDDFSLIKEQIELIHNNGIKLSPKFKCWEAKKTFVQGAAFANNVISKAIKLDIPFKTAIFLELSDDDCVFMDFLIGYTDKMISYGYTPAFKVNSEKNKIFLNEYKLFAKFNYKIFNECFLWDESTNNTKYLRETTLHIVVSDKLIGDTLFDSIQQHIVIRKIKNIYSTHDNLSNSDYSINILRDENVLTGNMF